jgi:hypothetical protein
MQPCASPAGASSSPQPTFNGAGQLRSNAFRCRGAATGLIMPE